MSECELDAYCIEAVTLRTNPRKGEDEAGGAMVKQRIFCELNSRKLLYSGINLRTGAQGIFPEAHVVDVDYNDFDPAAGAERKERWETGFEKITERIQKEL